jgi:hypothetical protein
MSYDVDLHGARGRLNSNNTWSRDQGWSQILARHPHSRITEQLGHICFGKQLANIKALLRLELYQHFLL